MANSRVSSKAWFVVAVLMSVPIGASAQLNINEMAAGAAIPFLTDSTGLSTEIVITNMGTRAAKLHYALINGDEGENCEGQSWTCTLTARETVQISVANDSLGGSTIDFECDELEGSNGPPFAGNDGHVDTIAERGVLWVTVENEFGTTTADNLLFAHWTVVDTAASVAYSAPAAGFQGINNNGDKRYEFDGLEYSQFPDALATDYLPPAHHPSSLLVFTLDLTHGSPPPVRSNVLWYDDDEIFQDDNFVFECFDVIDYNEIAPGLAALETAGHMEMDSQTVQYDPPHSPDFARRVPFLCFNIQDAPMHLLADLEEWDFREEQEASLNTLDVEEDLDEWLVAVPGGTTVTACAQSATVFVPDVGDSQPFFETGF